MPNICNLVTKVWSNNFLNFEYSRVATLARMGWLDPLGPNPIGAAQTTILECPEVSEWFSLFFLAYRCVLGFAEACLKEVSEPCALGQDSMKFLDLDFQECQKSKFYHIKRKLT